jgi:hypothetical protein
MPGRKLVCYVLTALAGLSASARAEDVTLVTQDGVALVLPASSGCAPNMALVAKAEADAAFRSGALAKALDGARVALTFKCPEVKDLLIVGFVDDSAVYGGVASSNSNWGLVEIPVAFALDASGLAASPAPPVEVAEKPTELPPADQPATPPVEVHTAIVEMPPPADGGLANLALPPAPGAAAPETIAEPAVGNVGIEQFKDIQQRVEQAKFPVDGYNFSGLMAAIYAGDTARIPDDIETRKAVFSVLSSMAENCGALSISMERDAAIYVSPEMAGAMLGGSYDDAADQGLKMLMEMMQGVANGGPGGIIDYAERNSVRVAEGMEDGRTLVRGTACSGELYRTFQNNIFRLIEARSGRTPAAYDQIAYSAIMSPRLRDRLGYDDPAVALREREVKGLLEGTGKACSAAFASEAFCKCAVDAIKVAGLDDATMKAIGADFRQVAKHAPLRAPLHSCQP